MEQTTTSIIMCSSIYDKGFGYRPWLDIFKIVILMARPVGVEPTTPRSEVWCSIQLSYGRKWNFDILTDDVVILQSTLRNNKATIENQVAIIFSSYKVSINNTPFSVSAVVIYATALTSPPVAGISSSSLALSPPRFGQKCPEKGHQDPLHAAQQPGLPAICPAPPGHGPSC